MVNTIYSHTVIQHGKELDSTETDQETSRNESYTDANDNSDDEILAVGQESDDEIMIPETIVRPKIRGTLYAFTLYI